ncbi:MAG: murein biosynthesis integral membrane protein MurJ [Spirochaetes bacterium]|nr:murein biosynthesis integral membrane protein MurJ [Spirochaetota bacterium]
MENRRIARSAVSIGAVTFASRLFGLLREWLRGYLLGTTGSSDAFSMAFLFPNLMRRLVGEGALLVAYVPVFSDYLEKGKRDELCEFVHSFFTLLFCFLLACVAAVVVFAPLLRFFLPRFAEVPGKIELTVLLTRMMFPYILFISLAALTQAILNSYKVFVPSALTPILLNMSIITAGFTIGARMKDPSLALGIGVLIGGMLQLFFQIPFLGKEGIRYRLSFKWGNPGVRRVFLLMIPAAIGAGVYQINALVSQFIAAYLEEGSVAALRFSNTVVEVVLGVFVISISTVILPALAEKSSQGDPEAMKRILNFALRLTFLVTLPATFGLVVLRYPIVEMLFRYGRFTSESASMVSYAILFHAIGISATGGSRVLVQMFYSLKDMKTPVWTGVVSVLVNIPLCIGLSGPLRLGGVALAGSISSFCNFFLLYFILSGKVGKFMDKETMKVLGKAFSSSAGMGIALFFAKRLFAASMSASRLYNAGLTFLLLVFGVALYFALNLAMKNRDVMQIFRIFLKRLERSEGKKLDL